MLQFWNCCWVLKSCYHESSPSTSFDIVISSTRARISSSREKRYCRFLHQVISFIFASTNQLIYFIWLIRNNISRILFVPYAGQDHDAYTEKVSTALKGFGKSSQIEIVMSSNLNIRRLWNNWHSYIQQQNPSNY